MSDVQGLLCILWRDYTGEIPSVRKNCSKCRAEIAVDEKNIPRVVSDGIVLLCITCGIKTIAEAKNDPVKFASLIGGKIIESPEDALIAALSQIKRRRG